MLLVSLFGVFRLQLEHDILTEIACRLFYLMLSTCRFELVDH